MDSAQEMKNLGQMIRLARQKAGMTQLSLGVELGFKSGQPISELERGVKTLSVRHIPHMARSLGIAQEQIIEHLVQVQRARINRGVSSDQI